MYHLAVYEEGCLLTLEPLVRVAAAPIGIRSRQSSGKCATTVDRKSGAIRIEIAKANVLPVAEIAAIFQSTVAVTSSVSKVFEASLDLG
jgi:hypothetical protein